MVTPFRGGVIIRLNAISYFRDNPPSVPLAQQVTVAPSVLPAAHNHTALNILFISLSITEHHRSAQPALSHFSLVILSSLSLAYISRTSGCGVSPASRKRNLK